MSTTDPAATALTLRSATLDDKQAMLEVMAPYRNAHFPGGLTASQVRIAEIDKMVVGFVGWRGNQVLALYVADAWRGKRIVGSRLLQAAEVAIQDAGYEKVRVMIDADANSAHRFYLGANYVTEPTDWDADIAWMTKMELG